MKNKNLLLIIALFFSTLMMFGQVPQRIDFQAMARDGSGNPLINQNVSLRLSIMEGSTTVYSEVHAVTTDDYGLFTVAIGEGTPISGDFTAIDWSTGNQKVKVEIDPNGGSSFVYMGTSNLASVPYALYSANGGSSWSQNGNDIYYNDGNVGIGTNSPEGSLHVPFSNGNTTSIFGSNITTWTSSTNVSIGDDSEPVLYIGVNEDDKAFFNYTPDNYVGIGAYSGSHPLILQAAGGNTGVGESVGNPLVKFQVEESGSTGVTASDLGLEGYPDQIVASAIYGSSFYNASEGSYGVIGYSYSPDALFNLGIYGEAQSSASSNNTAYGVYGHIEGDGDNGLAIVGIDLTTGSNSYAGYFYGNVSIDGDLSVTGTISKGGGTFKIDHPQDPANKYLIHSFVESPDMMNVYNGNVVTDAEGIAVVELPSYFEAENIDFKYQLTVIGQFAQAIIKEEISDNQFTIQTDKPNVKVSWQVTGVRNDAWANAHRVVPEVEKTGKDKGHYLHPELYGKSKDEGIMSFGMKNNLPKHVNPNPASKPLGKPTGPMGIRK